MNIYPKISSQERTKKVLLNFENFPKKHKKRHYHAMYLIYTIDKLANTLKQNY